MWTLLIELVKRNAEHCSAHGMLPVSCRAMLGAPGSSREYSRAILTLMLLLSAATALASEATESAFTGKTVSLQLHVRTDKTNQTLRLQGADARQQLLVTAKQSSGALLDFTRKVAYESVPGGIVRVDRNGWVVPLADGKAAIIAKGPDGLTASMSVTVEQFKTVHPINFPNQIVPIFTKAGCNAGGCHGKSGGQNGFKLSLLGFEPAEDYEHLVKEARGRRLFPAAPEYSLLLLKGAATLPHGGGKRLDPASSDYKLIVRWISQGMPFGKTNDPAVARIQVSPQERTMPLGGEQQLVVLAHYTDGSVEDVTRGALYEPNDKDMAQTSEDGHVTFLKQPGDVAVMVRYQAKVAVFNATIPLGAPVEKLPTAKNFIDE